MKPGKPTQFDALKKKTFEPHLKNALKFYFRMGYSIPFHFNSCYCKSHANFDISMKLRIFAQLKKLSTKDHLKITSNAMFRMGYLVPAPSIVLI